MRLPELTNGIFIDKCSVRAVERVQRISAYTDPWPAPAPTDLEYTSEIEPSSGTTGIYLRLAHVRTAGTQLVGSQRLTGTLKY